MAAFQGIPVRIVQAATMPNAAGKMVRRSAPFEHPSPRPFRSFHDLLSEFNPNASGDPLAPSDQDVKSFCRDLEEVVKASVRYMRVEGWVYSRLTTTNSQHISGSHHASNTRTSKHNPKWLTRCRRITHFSLTKRLSSRAPRHPSRPTPSRAHPPSPSHPASRFPREPTRACTA